MNYKVPISKVTTPERGATKTCVEITRYEVARYSLAGRVGGQVGLHAVQQVGIEHHHRAAWHGQDRHRERRAVGPAAEVAARDDLLGDVLPVLLDQRPVVPG